MGPNASNTGWNQPMPNGLVVVPTPSINNGGADGARPSIRSALIVGTGLMGTSVALALREHGVEMEERR